MTKESLAKLFNREFRDAKDNWKAKCPFHGGGNERTPSFYVHKDENIAHCFGCSISGHIAKLGSLYSGKAEAEVYEALGITVQDEVRKRIGRAHQAAVPATPTRYPKSWLAPWKKEIHAYTIERGFTPSTLIRAGARYDRSKNRQVFPWYSQEGDLVGATGRDCGGTSLAKWYHYWDFDRGNHLYTLPAVRSEGHDARSNERCVPETQLLIVEGIFDLLWYYQETGNENVVAPIAATLTRVQGQKVRARSERVIIGFDNDEAGIRGSFRSYRYLRASCNVFFVNWPVEAKDWMDLDAEHCREAVQEPLTYLQWTRKIRAEGKGNLLVDPRPVARKEPKVR